MTFLFDVLIWVHVATGFVGLAAFWVPVFARKGSRAHVRAGRVYTYCAYVVTLSAVTASAGRIVTCLSQGIGVADRPDLYGFPLFLGGAAPLGLRDRGTARRLAVDPADGHRHSDHRRLDSALPAEVQPGAAAR